MSNAEWGGAAALMRAKANSKNKKRKKSRNGGGVNVLQILFHHIYLIIRAFVRGLFGKGI